MRLCFPATAAPRPIQWAVAMGEVFTGNTTMLLEEGLDTGPILLQQALAIWHQIKRRRISSTCWPKGARRWW